MDQLETDGRASSDFEVAEHTVTTKWRIPDSTELGQQGSTTTAAKFSSQSVDSSFKLLHTWTIYHSQDLRFFTSDQTINGLFGLLYQLSSICKKTN